jgi:protein gp37
MPTKIDWCDDVWNPVWGCSFGCPFCYAKRFARRFGKQVAKWNGLTEKETKRLIEFKPTFLPKNFEKKLAGKFIFVNSMSDTADWKREWIEKVLSMIEKEESRIFLFLTKRPEKTEKLIENLKLPQNTYWGISATNGKEMIERVKKLSRFPTNNLFASFEPMLGSFIPDKSLLKLKWVIFGAQTNPLKLPRGDHLIKATDWLKKNGIKVFWKDNLKGLGIENFPKERPKKEG